MSAVGRAAPWSAVPRASWRGCACGFTMVELLVGLAILAFALAFALPRFGATTAVEVRAASRTVAAGLRGARELAIASADAVALRLDLDQHQMVLLADASRPTAAPRKLPDDVQYRLVTARSELFGKSGGQIRFFPDGSSTGGRVTVHAGPHIMLVDVDWLTGRIALSEGSAEDLRARASSFEPLGRGPDPGNVVALR